ncbi:MAG: hypothetical protein GX066_07725 [Clostridiaceae bacterium]|nr:hypothetical protein [Clostridiaceae bacterium]
MILKKIENFFRAVGSLNIFDRKIEILLVFISLLCFLSLIIAQIGLVNETTRTFFTNISEYEGVNINDLSNIFTQGELSLQLIGIEPNNQITVLLNGIPSYCFDTDTLFIKVKNKCVVEIDGTKVKEPFRVKITNASDNIATNCLGKEVEIHSNIAVLTRILLK